MFPHLILFASVALLLGCATPAIEGPSGAIISAYGETVAVDTTGATGGGNPAIWRNSADPALSLIVTAVPAAGIQVYRLDGTLGSRLLVGNVGSIDLLQLRDGTVLVAASDAGDPTIAHLRLLTLDPQTAELTQVARLPIGIGEATDLCVGPQRDDGGVDIYSPMTNGDIYRTTVSNADAGWGSLSLKPFAVSGQPLSCVVDARNDALYVSEAAVGIWRFTSASPDGRLIVAAPDAGALTMAAASKNAGHLVASNRNKGGYAVFALPNLEPVGTFGIKPVRGRLVESTSGIALDPGSFNGSYAGGLLVAQNRIDDGNATTFQLVDWTAVKAAIPIE